MGVLVVGLPGKILDHGAEANIQFTQRDTYVRRARIGHVHSLSGSGRSIDMMDKRGRGGFSRWLCACLQKDRPQIDEDKLCAEQLTQRAPNIMKLLPSLRTP